MIFIKWLKVKISYAMLIFIFICVFSGFLKQCLLCYLMILLHEIGHLSFVKIFGGEVYCLNMNLFGGRFDVNLEKVKYKWQKLIIDMGRHCYKYLTHSIFTICYKG